MNPVKQKQRKGAYKLMSDASIHAMENGPGHGWADAPGLGASEGHLQGGNSSG